MKKAVLVAIFLVLAGILLGGKVQQVSANTVNITSVTDTQKLQEQIKALRAQLIKTTDPTLTVASLDAKTAQSEFTLMTKGTLLEGHILTDEDQYLFTDGKEGVDTVIYKNKRSDYNLYRGKKLSSKGYNNVVIVTGKKDHFIEVDVNSEFIQFADKTVSIPDFKTVTTKSKTKRENLSVTSIKNARNDLELGTTGTLLDQTLTVVVNNNEFGKTVSDGRIFEYTVYLYEAMGGKKKKIQKVASGEALVPTANAATTFDVNIQAGGPYNPDDLDRKFQALVTIDSKDEVKETNEKDNTGWSSQWTSTYYKG